MLVTIQSDIRRWQANLHRWVLEPRVHRILRMGLSALAGFVLSAASLSHKAQSFALSLICAQTGTGGILTALGAAAGYLLLWGQAGIEGVLGSALALALSLTLGSTRAADRSPWVMSAAAGLAASAAGLWAQQLGMGAALGVYLLRVASGILSTRLFIQVRNRGDTVADWVAWAIGVLGLAQVVPVSWLSLGFPAAAALTTASAFPAAALAGLALDLADVTPVPMTGVLCLAWLLRLIPGKKQWRRALAPALVFPVVMALTGNWDLAPLPGLAVGGLLGLLMPGAAPTARRRGEVGVAQVRLELAADVFSRMEQLLLELRPASIDEQALIAKACERACGTCSYRKTCTGKAHAEALSPQILNLPILDSSLHFSCRRVGRLLQELRRSQEQLRLLRSMHQQNSESRQAVIQQYRFMTEYLQDLSDDLGKRLKQADQRFTPEIAFSANRSRTDNGDRCLSFSGTGNRHYVAILDGMGRGIGAADEAVTAGRLLKGLLTAGMPAQHALSTLNSLCALRGRAGAVTVDLAELYLDSGKAALYKWGAPSAWLLRREGREKIGTAGPPPGLLVADSPGAAQRLSLRRGEILLLLSDGVDGEAALPLCLAEEEPPGELAARILERGTGAGNDDATVAIVRLRPRDLSA